MENKEEALDLASIPFSNQIRYKLITPEEAKGVSYARQQIQLLFYQKQDVDNDVRHKSYLLRSAYSD